MRLGRQLRKLGFNLTRVRLKRRDGEVAKSWAELQPHESSSETAASTTGVTVDQSFNLTRVRLKPTLCLRRFQLERFNLTRVRLKLAVVIDKPLSEVASTSREFV